MATLLLTGAGTGTNGVNIAPNGDFELVPSFTAATNTAGRFIDGTAAGSTTTKTYKWAIPSAGPSSPYTAQFDTSVFYAGTASMKLSTTSIAGALVVATTANLTTPPVDEVINLLPSTTYTISAMVKTNNVFTNSVYVDLREYNSSRAALVTTSTSKLTGTNDWTQLSVTVTTNASTAYGAIILRNINAGNISDAWFDNVRLV